jgi:cytochrome P450
MGEGYVTDASTVEPTDDAGRALTSVVVPPEELDDPHPRYHRMRAETPRMLVPEFDEWIFTRFDDCEAVLRDHRFSSDFAAHTRRPVERGIPEEMRDVGGKSLLQMDPPDHTRIRKLVSKAFTPRTIERLRPHVADLVDGFLDNALERAGESGRFDVISSLGYPLPTTVICELMGVPLADRDLFGPWSSAATRVLDGNVDDATMQAGALGMMQIVNYMNGLFDERRTQPRDDLISRLLAVEEEGDRLTPEEMRSTVVLLFVAGHETTTNLIGNGTVALLRNRDQWDRLRDDPSLIGSAIEELLRYDGPVHVTGRTATCDVEVGDVTIERGQGVTTLLAAANRDPERFPDPDRLDVGRADGPHLTFSHGIHYCLGAALARLEGQEAFLALTRRFAGLELAEEPVHREHFVLRGFKEVHVTP